MGTIGNTATPTFGWDLTSGFHEVAELFANSSGNAIVLTTLHGYLGGGSGSITAQLVVWDSSGNILWNSGNFTVSGGSHSAGGQNWYSKAIPSISQPTIANGASIYIGWWVAAEQVFSIYNGSGKWNAINGSSSAPTNFTGSTQPGSPFVQGGIGAYADYTVSGGGGGGGGGGGTGGPKIRRSSAWSAPPWKIRRSSAWAGLTWKIRRSSAWSVL